jgi:hypothetical protein
LPLKFYEIGRKKEKINTNLVKVECFQDDMSVSWARSVKLTLDFFDIAPLVYKQSLVAVLEPREIAQPRKVRRHRSKQITNLHSAPKI